jgi:hypothetical protein
MSHYLVDNGTTDYLRPCLLQRRSTDNKTLGSIKLSKVAMSLFFKEMENKSLA